jgi:putative FmdB family regulatory protein
MLGAYMPIYEFYCPDCNTLFNFFSRTINTSKTPFCPKCKTRKLERQMSAFAFTGKAKEGGEDEDLPFDEAKMEKAMQVLASEADRINEDDPRQAADLMRKLTDMTGMELGAGMEEALSAHGAWGRSGTGGSGNGRSFGIGRSVYICRKKRRDAKREEKGAGEGRYAIRAVTGQPLPPHHHEKSLRACENVK